VNTGAFVVGSNVELDVGKTDGERDGPTGCEVGIEVGLSVGNANGFAVVGLDVGTVVRGQNDALFTCNVTTLSG
jgi:hypothetical protein